MIRVFNTIDETLEWLPLQQFTVFFINLKDKAIDKSFERLQELQ